MPLGEPLASRSEGVTALGANRTRRNGGNDVNDPTATKYTGASAQRLLATMRASNARHRASDCRPPISSSVLVSRCSRDIPPVHRVRFYGTRSVDDGYRTIEGPSHSTLLGPGPNGRARAFSKMSNRHDHSESDVAKRGKPARRILIPFRFCDCQALQSRCDILLQLS